MEKDKRLSAIEELKELIQGFHTWIRQNWGQKPTGHVTIHIIAIHSIITILQERPNLKASKNEIIAAIALIKQGKTQKNKATDLIEWVEQQINLFFNK